MNLYAIDVFDRVIFFIVGSDQIDLMAFLCKRRSDIVGSDSATLFRRFEVLVYVNNPHLVECSPQPMCQNHQRPDLLAEVRLLFKMFAHNGVSFIFIDKIKYHRIIVP